MPPPLDVQIREGVKAIGTVVQECSEAYDRLDRAEVRYPAP
jgi:hypothetical protein